MKAATTPGPRAAILQQFTLVQLKDIAKEHGIELRATGVFEAGEVLKSKPEIVQKLANASNSLPTRVIEAYARRHGIGVGPSVAEASVPAAASKPAPAAVPPNAVATSPDESPREPPPRITQSTSPITRPPTTIPFDEVLAYVKAYNFMSNYGEEASYQAELAGALRERYGAVVRKEYPVPVVGKRRTIDIDVGGVGIEIKANLRTGVSLRNARAQLEEYLQHYGPNLIFMLIGTHGFNAEKHDIRNLRVTFLDR